jgi:hypothetical protein
MDGSKLMTDMGLATAPIHSNNPAEALQPGAGLSVVDRTAAAIAAQAVHIRHQGRASLTLVVRPDGQTELRVDLRWIDGQVEARAILHHGDRSAVESRWADLQEQMHRHGVRLAPLEQGGATSGQSDHFSPRREPAPVPEAEPPRKDLPRLQQTTQTTQTTSLIRPLALGVLECYA